MKGGVRLCKLSTPGLRQRPDIQSPPKQGTAQTALAAGWRHSVTNLVFRSHLIFQGLFCQSQQPLGQKSKALFSQGKLPYLTSLAVSKDNLSSMCSALTALLWCAKNEPLGCFWRLWFPVSPLICFCRAALCLAHAAHCGAGCSNKVFHASPGM